MIKVQNQKQKIRIKLLESQDLNSPLKMDLLMKVSGLMMKEMAMVYRFGTNSISLFFFFFFQVFYCDKIQITIKLAFIIIINKNNKNDYKINTNKLIFYRPDGARYEGWII